MWPWLVGGFAAAIMIIIVCAAYVALFVLDSERRRDGYRVLALVLSATSGSTGLLALALGLHQAGLF
jgi:hypothetical protein